MRKIFFACWRAVTAGGLAFFLAAMAPAAWSAVTADGLEAMLKEANGKYDTAIAADEASKQATDTTEKINKGNEREQNMAHALNLYRSILASLYDCPGLAAREQIALDASLGTTASFLAEYSERITATEIAVMPQIIFRNSSILIKDISSGYDFFFPPFIRLPENNRNLYMKALGDLPKPKMQSDKATSVTKPTAGSASLDKKVFQRILGSPAAQKFYIGSQFAALKTRIAKLESLGAKSAADHYNLGNAYLMLDYYSNLDKTLEAYSRSTEKMQDVINPPLYVQMMALTEAGRGCGDEYSFDEELTRDNLPTLRPYIECRVHLMRIQLPEGISDDAGSPRARKASRSLEKAMFDARVGLFTDFQNMVESIYYANVLSVSDKTMAAFARAAEMEASNPYYRLRLGNLHRMRALDALIRQRWAGNEHWLGASTMNPFPRWIYQAREKKADIDLSQMRSSLLEALKEYEAVRELDRETGERALGIFYLGLMPFNGDFAGKAMEHLNNSGNSAESALAREYAFYLISRAQAEDDELDLPRGLQDAAEKVQSEFDRIEQGSPLKPQALSILTEKALTHGMARVIGTYRVRQSFYEDWIENLQKARALDPENPFLSLLHGYLKQKQGMTLGIMATFSAIGESFELNAQTVGAANAAGTTRPDSPVPADKLSAYAAHQGKILAEQARARYSGQLNIIVKRYNESGLLATVDIYSEALSKNQDFTPLHYNLGMVYTVLEAFYTAHKDKSLGEKYSRLAEEAFARYVLLSNQNGWN